MAWLVRDGEVLASVETATSRRERRRGLLGRDHVDEVLRLRTRSVHTCGMRMPIDVAVCRPIGSGAGSGDRYRVLRVLTLRRWRVTRPSLRPIVVLEAEAGAFRAWGVGPGDVVSVR